MKRLLLFGLLASFAATAQTAQTARLDSMHNMMVYNDKPDTIQRLYYSYDNANYKNAYKDYGYDENKECFLQTSISQTFNSNHQLLEEIDSSEGFLFKYEYQYNQNGNILLESISKKKAFEINYEAYQKTEYTYDSNENLLLEFKSDFDTNSKVYVGKYRIENSFTNSGDLGTKSEFFMIGNYWDNAIKTIYYTDGNHNVIDEIMLTHDVGYTTMYFYSKTSRLFNSANHKIEEVKMNYVEHEHKWKNLTKYEYIYDINGNLITETELQWNSIKNQWDNYFKEEYVYDQEYLIEEDAKSFVWVDSQKKNILLSHSYFKWDSQNMLWYTNQKVVYYYSGKGLSVESITKSKEVSVFPNPTSDLLYFDVAHANVQLFDVAGNVVLQSVVQKSTPISMQQLANGVYFYSITADGEVTSGKIIKY